MVYLFAEGKTLTLRANLCRHIANEQVWKMVFTSAHKDFRVVSVTALQLWGKLTRFIPYLEFTLYNVSYQVNIMSYY